MLRSRSAKGFTLPEILAVLVSTTVLIALIIPTPRVHGFLECSSKWLPGVERDYVLFVPHDYDYAGAKSYPLLLFLHGLTDHPQPARHGLGRVIRDRQETFPCFALFPRIQGYWMDDSDETRAALTILEHVEERYNIDKRRIYVTGMSDGGTGALHFAAEFPGRWAAIVPMSAAPWPQLAPRISHVPCWYFYGDVDPALPVEASRGMVEALRAAGGKPRFTELKAHDHNVWDTAYNMPELWEWLLEQRLPE